MDTALRRWKASCASWRTSWSRAIPRCSAICRASTIPRRAPTTPAITSATTMSGLRTANRRPSPAVNWPGIPTIRSMPDHCEWRICAPETGRFFVRWEGLTSPTEYDIIASMSEGGTESARGKIKERQNRRTAVDEEKGDRRFGGCPSAQTGCDTRPQRRAATREQRRRGRKTQTTRHSPRYFAGVLPAAGAQG